MEQMQRGGRQIPNIDSLHSSVVIKAQLDGGSCRMAEWSQCEQDLDIKLHAMPNGVCTRRELLLLLREKKANLANSRQTQHKPSSAKWRMSMHVFFCM